MSFYRTIDLFCSLTFQLNERSSKTTKLNYNLQNHNLTEYFKLLIINNLIIINNNYFLEKIIIKC